MDRVHRRSFGWLALALALVGGAGLVGCTYEPSTRADFERPLPPFPDGGVDAALSGGVAWRADHFEVVLPLGLAAFSDLIRGAVAGQNLNFVVAAVDGDLEAGEWAVQIGSSERTGNRTYRWLEAYPPAELSVMRSGSQLTTSPPFSMDLVLWAPFEIRAPIVAGRLTMELSADQQELLGGRYVGIIRAEEAARSFIDLQSDGDPNNDVPLSNFLGVGDVDEDGDGTTDDFMVDVSFESARASLAQ